MVLFRGEQRPLRLARHLQHRQLQQDEESLPRRHESVGHVHFQTKMVGEKNIFCGGRERFICSTSGRGYHPRVSSTTAVQTTATIMFSPTLLPLTKKKIPIM